MLVHEKELIFNDHFRTWGASMEAVCNVKIYEAKDREEYEVILREPYFENYIGKSTTNFFERFATEIKAKYLPNVHHTKIRWFNHIICRAMKNEMVLYEKIRFENGEYQYGR